MITDDVLAKKKARTHTVYKNRAGKRIPAVTTITGVMDKPALVVWANRIGLEGIKVREYVDELAVIGKLAHYLIECHCKGLTPELADYTPNQVKIAGNSYTKWIDWQKQTGFIPLANELILISEKHQFGGTLDIIGEINGRQVLIDIKTSKGIFGEHRTQVGGGYRLLALENGYNIQDVIITRVGRSEIEGFEQVNISQAECELHQRRFLVCRELYELNKEVNRSK